MFRHAVLAFALLLTVGVAVEANAQRLYYGTQRHTSARHYSGEYQAMRPNVVPTFSMPVYGGGGFRTYYGAGYGGYYGRGYPLYHQPVIVYPPAIYYGF